jgi:hypothetical protein
LAWQQPKLSALLPELHTARTLVKTVLVSAQHNPLRPNSAPSELIASTFILAAPRNVSTARTDNVLALAADG